MGSGGRSVDGGLARWQGVLLVVQQSATCLALSAASAAGVPSGSHQTSSAESVSHPNGRMNVLRTS